MLPAPIVLDLPPPLIAERTALQAACSQAAAPNDCVVGKSGRYHARIRELSESSYDLEVCIDSRCESHQFVFRPEDSLEQRARSLGIAAGALFEVQREVGGVPRRAEATPPERLVSAVRAHAGPLTNVPERSLERSKASLVKASAEAALLLGNGIDRPRWGGELAMSLKWSTPTLFPVTLGPRLYVSWSASPAGTEGLEARWATGGLGAGLECRITPVVAIEFVGEAGLERLRVSVPSSGNQPAEAQRRRYWTSSAAVNAVFSYGDWGAIAGLGVGASPAQVVTLRGTAVGNNPNPFIFGRLGVRGWLF